MAGDQISGNIESLDALDSLQAAYKPLPKFSWVTHLKFHTFFHPHVSEFIKNLNWKGVSGLLTLEGNQLLDNDPSANETFFQKTYIPNVSLVNHNYPKEDVDFSGGAYSVYNWELFFHVPLLIADRLSKNQQFQDAQKWFHFIFDPTSNSTADAPERYWNTLPFFNNTSPDNEQIELLMEALSYAGNNNLKQAQRADLEKCVAEWRENPFSPHLIARTRITAYQKTVVRKYIDNLISWGDQLFRRETIEAINEATQLYVLAYNLLGPRPEEIPQRGQVNVEGEEYLSYFSLPQIDDFSNAMVEMENEFPFSSNSPSSSIGNGPNVTLGLGSTPALYFCIPRNENLLEYWDTVEDRLFKVRNCMNIEGQVRQLPLFEPPIDPALLVQATSMGLDLNSVMNDLTSPLPHYRFSVLFQKATELCGELKSLGAALLSALEKKDAEELAVLRATQETGVLKMVSEIKRGQIQEAETAVTALERTRDVTEARHQYYEGNLKSGLSFHERANLDKLKAANDKQGNAMMYELSAQGASNIPDITAGTSGMASPVLTAAFGGKNLVSAFQAFARYINGQAADDTYQASKSSIMGGHQRRENEWKLQSALAAKELLQIDKQIAAAQIRVAIAEKEMENHDKQIENSAAIQDFLCNKYTNQDLYGWMLSQISAVYFQCYKLAYDISKRAERAYRFECGLTSSNFIQFGYWDSLKKGLLSGERLHLDLRRMELAYLDHNKREYEITKQVSVLLHDPMALINLKETGQCEIDLTEGLWDADYPGHYMRRIKTVSLTIPATVGPYTSVNCTLTLLSNKARIDSGSTEPYGESDEGDDSRFNTSFAALQSIATSHGQNDCGMFELNFRDECYLPFEGAGAISRWRIEMPLDSNAFDLNTIADIIFHIRYTARDGGDILKNAAKSAWSASIEDASQFPLARLFSAKHEFSNEWYRFLHPSDTSDEQTTLPLDFAKARFPFRFRGKTITINQLELFLKLKETPPAGNLCSFSITDPNGQQVLPDPEMQSAPSFMNGIPHALINIADAPIGTWLLSGQQSEISALDQAYSVDDMIVVCYYSLKK